MQLGIVKKYFEKVKVVVILSNCIGIFVSIQFLSFVLKTSFVIVLVLLHSSDEKVFSGSPQFF
jgi:hypothetical protein